MNDAGTFYLYIALIVFGYISGLVGKDFKFSAVVTVSAVLAAAWPLFIIMGIWWQHGAKKRIGGGK